ncbi:MAG TPA: PH domain-containing protein [Pyrinomonadaceae bacterium]|jgi:membrane protein YdbS with pleckstrin-like domain|nr:PH domain-containing protein [Pyrinomonadaceae bacterium]
MNECHNCGAALPHNARFCAACGAPADSEQTRYASDETRVAAARPRPVQPLPVEPLRPPAPARREQPTDAEEKVIFKVRPTLLFIKIGYALAALGAVLLVALLAWQPWVTVPVYVSIPLALALLLIPAYKHLMRNTILYTLTDSKIEMDRGLVSRTTRNIPLRNIQDVTVTTSVPQRLLRFGDLVIDNASETGGTTVLHNIPDPRRHADLLLRELRRWH